MVLSSWMLYELLKCVVRSTGSSMILAVSEATILDFMAYGIIALCSYLLYHFTDKKLLLSIGILVVSVAVLSLKNHDFNPNSYKYPPGLLYTSWGLLVTSLSFYVLRKLDVKKLPRIILFISANSLWIYFWHALFLTLEKEFWCIENWAVNWLVTVAFSLIMCYVQNHLKIGMAKCKSLFV